MSTPNSSDKTYAVAKTDAEWREELGPERYPVLREAGDRARLDRRAARREPRRPLHLRRVRRRAVQERHQVRLRMRLAELLRVGPPRCGRADRGQLARHGAHRGALRELRLAPRPRLPRRLRHADRRPVLHELARRSASPEQHADVTERRPAPRRAAGAALALVGDGCRARRKRELLPLVAAAASRRRPLVAAAVAAHRAARRRPRAPRARDRQGRRARGLGRGEARGQAAARAAADRHRRRTARATRCRDWEQEAVASGVAHVLSLLLDEAGWGVIWRTGLLHPLEGGAQDARSGARRGAARLALRRRQAGEGQERAGARRSSAKDYLTTL